MAVSDARSLESDQVDTVKPVLRAFYDKATIKGAPRCDAGEPLSRPEEEALFAYYGMNVPGNVDSGGDEEGAGDMAAGHPGNIRPAEPNRPWLRKRDHRAAAADRSRCLARSSR